MFIGEEYLPQLDGETNCKEFLNCNILEANDKTMVLNIDNVAVLFGAINKENIIQAKTDYILTDGYENFTLTVKKSENRNKRKILNNTELYKNNSDFNLYYYGLDEVNVTIKGQIKYKTHNLDTVDPFWKKYLFKEERENDKLQK